MRRMIHGNAHRPNKTDATRNRIIRTRIIRTSAVLPVPPCNARKTESKRMMRISSNTAAPSRLKPTRLRRAFSSIKVWAEILTLVAPNVNPRKSAEDCSKPKSNPVLHPNRTGTITPIKPASAATRMFWRISPRCSSNPARNINKSTPNSPSLATVSASSCSMNGRLSRLMSDGPRRMPTNNSPSTDG